MENKSDIPNEKKMSQVRPYSHHVSAPLNLINEPLRPKPFNLNEAVRSLDLALGRLKKSKQEECTSTVPNRIVRRSGTSSVFMDSNPSSNINPGIDNASLMSMNFSHYELVRNLSRCTFNSEGAFSSTTCNTYAPVDTTLKDEHLEKYFRSAEMWTRKSQPPHSEHVEIPKK